MTLSILRYPKTQNRSLQAWSAADELSLEYLKEEKIENNTTVYNDRFGYLSCQLPSSTTVCVYKSQEKAIAENYLRNDLGEFNPSSLFDEIPSIETALVSVPKSLDLFEYYLQHISLNSDKNTVVICSFMTRHFTKRMLEIASEYFEITEQSKAKKKARLLILKDKKETIQRTLVHELKHKEHTLKQYYGVFSANNIDYASQFFLENLDVRSTDKTVLDLASGNGVIAQFIQQKNPEADIHLIDDFSLAIASSKLNLAPEKSHFHYNDTLDNFEPNFFDLVVSNPPFHFEHENNIEVSLGLFQQVSNVLKTTGCFRLVANSHLNYKTHLQKIFGVVDSIAENDKFVVYECYN